MFNRHSVYHNAAFLFTLSKYTVFLLIHKLSKRYYFFITQKKLSNAYSCKMSKYSS